MCEICDGTGGVLARNPKGEIVYCQCADGVWAEMEALTERLQGLRETLQQAQQRPDLAHTLPLLHLRWDQLQTEYDRLERRYREQRHKLPACEIGSLAVANYLSR